MNENRRLILSIFWIIAGLALRDLLRPFSLVIRPFNGCSICPCA